MIGEVAHDREVVRNDDQRGVSLGLDLVQQVEDRRLHGDIQRRDRFVGDDHVGIAGQCASDRHPLLLTARELVGLSAGELRRQPHDLEEMRDLVRRSAPRQSTQAPKRPADCVADRVARVERAVGVLEDHLDRALDRGRPRLDADRTNLVALELDPAFARGFETYQDLGEGGLPAPGFADDGKRLTLRRRQIHAIQRPHRGAPRPEEAPALTIALVEAGDRQRQAGRGHLGRRDFNRSSPLPPGKLGVPDALHPVAALAGHGHARNCPGRAAARLDVDAARGEAAAAGARDSRRHLAGDGHERGVPLVAVERGQAVEERARVWMTRIGEDLPDRALLEELARIHDADPVAHAHHGAEIVADEQDGHLVTLAQLAHEVEHGRLHRHVEPGGRLIHDQERGLGDERHRDHDALLLAARQLVGIALEQLLAVRQLDLGEHRERPGAGRPFADALVDHGHFHELPAHRHDRVEARHRVLVHHRDAAPAHGAQLAFGQRGDVAPLEEDAPADHPAGPAEIPHDGQRHRRLAAPGFADQAHRLAPRELEAQAGNDIGLSSAGEIRDPDVLQSENRGVSHGARSRGARPPGG